MELEMVEHIIGIIYPDAIPRQEYKKVITILAEIGQMIESIQYPNSSSADMGTGNSDYPNTKKIGAGIAKRGSNGTAHSSNRLTAEQIEAARKMRREGKTISAIAGVLKCSSSGIRKYLIKEEEEKVETRAATRTCLKCDKKFNAKGDYRLCKRCRQQNAGIDEQMDL